MIVVCVCAYLSVGVDMDMGVHVHLWVCVWSMNVCVHDAFVSLGVYTSMIVFQHVPSGTPTDRDSSQGDLWL